MYTFRQTRDLFAVALDAGDISEEEYLLLWEANTSKNPDFPVHIYPTFHLDEKDTTEVKAEFRFEKKIFLFCVQCQESPSLLLADKGQYATE